MDRAVRREPALPLPRRRVSNEVGRSYDWKVVAVVQRYGSSL